LKAFQDKVTAQRDSLSGKEGGLAPAASTDGQPMKKPMTNRREFAKSFIAASTGALIMPRLVLGSSTKPSMK
jgi:hypothetical protein